MGFVALWASILQFLAQLPDVVHQSRFGGARDARGLIVGKRLVSTCQLSGWHSGSSGEKPLCQLAEITCNPKGNQLAVKAFIVQCVQVQVWEGWDPAVGMELCWMEGISDIHVTAGERCVSQQIAQSFRSSPLTGQTCVYLGDCHVCFSLGGNKTSFSSCAPAGALWEQ